jgi:Fic family protein
MKDLLKKSRKDLKISAKDLAQKMNIDQSLISKFESGNRRPTLKQVKQLAYILSIEEDKLVALWIKDEILGQYKQYPELESAIFMVSDALEEYGSSNENYSEALNHKIEKLTTLKNKLDQLRAYNSYRIAQALELEYTFESNRIEGNTLTLRETDLVINEGLTVSGKTMKEHLEAINHQEALEYIKYLVEKNSKFTKHELLNLHRLILKSIDSDNAGKYRNVQVMIKGSAHMPPPPYLVEVQMEDYFIWYENHKHKLHPVILAAEMHERLVTIHPFIDGNGRTSRLVMNLILLKHGFVIANIKGDIDSRMDYYKTLENTQTTGDKSVFHHFILDNEIKCLERYLQILS